MKRTIMRHLKYLIGVFAVCSLGCTSITSTPISRTESGMFCGDSNGKNCLFSQARPFRGTPVKLKIQTHVDVWIKEKYFLRGASAQGPWFEYHLPQKFLYVETKDVMTDQVVMVDFKRPASGTLGLKVEYSSDHYLKSVDSKLVDTTLADSAKLVGTMAKTFSLTTAGKQFGSDTVFIAKERTVAYQRFDINSPDYELQLEDFVNLHLNCHACETGPDYDNVMANKYQ